MKDPIPGGLHSRVVYKFTCAGCNACYVGETSRHFSTRVREHLAVDRASHIFKHLQNSERCRSLCSIDCFHILDHATTSFQLKIKEAIHIQKELPCLNQQLHHVNLKLSFQFTPFHVLLLLFVLISIFAYLLFNLLCNHSFNWRWQKFCRNMSFKLKKVVVFLKIIHE